MWKPEHRRAADRRGLRYDSDLTDGDTLIVIRLVGPDPNQADARPSLAAPEPGWQ